MNHWASKYVGIPYLLGGRDRKGLDCWGLLRLIYLEVKEIQLPELPGICAQATLGIAHSIHQISTQEWHLLDKPEEACVVAMSQKEILHHVGIWTFSDGGKIIHCREGCSVVAETVRTLRLRGVRIFQYYSYGTHN